MKLDYYLAQGKAFLSQPASPLKTVFISIGEGVLLATIARVSVVKVVLITTIYHSALPIFRRASAQFHYLPSYGQCLTVNLISATTALFLLNRWAKIGALAISILGVGVILYHKYIFATAERKIREQEAAVHKTEIFRLFRSNNEERIPEFHLRGLSVFNQFSESEKETLVTFYASAPKSTLEALLKQSDVSIQKKQLRCLLYLPQEEREQLKDILHSCDTFPFDLARGLSKTLAAIVKTHSLTPAIISLLTDLPEEKETRILEMALAIEAEHPNDTLEFSKLLTFITQVPEPLDDEQQQLISSLFQHCIVSFHRDVMKQLQQLATDDLKQSYLVALSFTLKYPPMLSWWHLSPMSLRERKRQIRLMESIPPQHGLKPSFCLKLLLKYPDALKKPELIPLPGSIKRVYVETDDIKETALFIAYELYSMFPNVDIKNFLEDYEYLEPTILIFPGIASLAKKYFWDETKESCCFPWYRYGDFWSDISNYAAICSDREEPVQELIDYYKEVTGNSDLDEFPDFVNDQLGKIWHAGSIEASKQALKFCELFGDDNHVPDSTFEQIAVLLEQWPDLPDLVEKYKIKDWRLRHFLSTCEPLFEFARTNPRRTPTLTAIFELCYLFPNVDLSELCNNIAMYHEALTNYPQLAEVIKEHFWDEPDNEADRVFSEATAPFLLALSQYCKNHSKEEVAARFAYVKEGHHSTENLTVIFSNDIEDIKRVDAFLSLFKGGRLLHLYFVRVKKLLEQCPMLPQIIKTCFWDSKYNEAIEGFARFHSILDRVVQFCNNQTNGIEKLKKIVELVDLFEGGDEQQACSGLEWFQEALTNYPQLDEVIKKHFWNEHKKRSSIFFSSGTPSFIMELSQFCKEHGEDKLPEVIKLWKVNRFNQGDGFEEAVNKWKSSNEATVTRS